MKAIDTNVLVRFLVNDDPAQAQKVRGIFSSAEKQRESLFVPLLVLQETIWVLESAYQIRRLELINALGELLLLPVLQFEHRSAVQGMLSRAIDNTLDLPDLLIDQSARLAGCETVLTFDKKAAKSDGFELITDRERSA
jgi:predicted nucleic-acid-binding protein